MNIALTGTPGTGKSCAATILRTRGFAVDTVEELARNHAALEDVNGELEVDTDRLSAAMPQNQGILIVEGHLAHHLPNDLCIILRCHPEELRRRLMARNYPEWKVMENLEAEAIDIVLSEAVETCGKICEVDTSDISVECVADIIESIINGKADEHPPGKIDWSGAVMDWY